MAVSKIVSEPRLANAAAQVYSLLLLAGMSRFLLFSAYSISSELREVTLMLMFTSRPESTISALIDLFRIGIPILLNNLG